MSEFLSRLDGVGKILTLGSRITPKEDLILAILQGYSKGRSNLGDFDKSTQKEDLILAILTKVLKGRSNLGHLLEKCNPHSINQLWQR